MLDRYMVAIKMRNVMKAFYFTIARSYYYIIKRTEDGFLKNNLYIFCYLK